MTEELTIEELRARGRVTEHITPGNVTFYGSGRPCPQCRNAWFSSSRDLALHKNVCMAGWSRNGDDGSEWRSVESDPELRVAIEKNGGKLVLGGLKYKVSKNGRWITRRPED